MRDSPRFPALVAAVLLSVPACGGTEDTPDAAGGGGNSAGQPSSSGSQNVGATGGITSDEQITLPMVVDFNFFPSGAFGRLIDTGADGVEDDFVDGCDGDDLGEWDNVAIDQTETACPERPDEVASDPLLELSRCNAFTFTPEGLDSVDQSTWAGVVFQNTTCNWGGDAGSPVVAGASTLRFWAWSDAESVGSEIVFQIGGVGNSSTPHRDGFSGYLT
ncbi:MAG TPA: hypothetical protein VHO25_24715, partial [Polyangiaceae bacterium]|nr:hypothetical protein [Polyangiaceae bacterium]